MATGPGSQWCLDEPLHSVVAFSRGPVVLVDQGDKPTPALHPAAGNGNHVERLTRSGAASGVAVDEVSRIAGYPAEWIGELELERQKRPFAAAQLEATPTVLARAIFMGQFMGQGIDGLTYGVRQPVRCAVTWVGRFVLPRARKAWALSVGRQSAGSSSWVASQAEALLGLPAHGLAAGKQRHMIQSDAVQPDFQVHG